MDNFCKAQKRQRSLCILQFYRKMKAVRLKNNVNDEQASQVKRFNTILKTILNGLFMLRRTLGLQR